MKGLSVHLPILQHEEGPKVFSLSTRISVAQNGHLWLTVLSQNCLDIRSRYVLPVLKVSNHCKHHALIYHALKERTFRGLFSFSANSKLTQYVACRSPKKQ